MPILNVSISVSAFALLPTLAAHASWRCCTFCWWLPWQCRAVEASEGGWWRHIGALKPVEWLLCPHLRRLTGK